MAFLGVVWFAARRRARWAPWALLISGPIWVPYYFVIASDFGAFGAPDPFKAAMMVAVFAVLAVLGAVLMLLTELHVVASMHERKTLMASGVLSSTFSWLEL